MGVFLLLEFGSLSWLRCETSNKEKSDERHKSFKVGWWQLTRTKSHDLQSTSCQDTEGSARLAGLGNVPISAQCNRYKCIVGVLCHYKAPVAHVGPNGRTACGHSFLQQLDMRYDRGLGV